MSIKAMNVNPKKFAKNQLKFYIILVPMAIFMIMPVVYVFSQALKPIDELIMFPPRFFVQKPTLDNFTDLFRAASNTGVPMSRYLFNSIWITIVSIVATLVMTTSTAYALSKKQFKAKKTIFKINQTALMFVAIAVAIPRYLIIDGVGLTDNYLVHILPYLAMPVGLFLVKQFIDQVPDELIEAAKIDGASDMAILFKIIIPLIKPALATVAILTFQMIWNSTESSSIYIITETKKTFAFYLTTLTANQAVSIAGLGMAAAAGLIMFLPNLIIFVIMQSNVMDTMSHSGIK
jgi:ABC-type glycerol-3-phosphate transport system permease component